MATLIAFSSSEAITRSMSITLPVYGAIVGEDEHFIDIRSDIGKRQYLR
jgi:hypothetical protein